MDLKRGDRVAYSAVWLAATQRQAGVTGMTPTRSGSTGWLIGEAAFARGVIVGFDRDNPFLAVVRWDGERKGRLVNVGNLCRADRIHQDAARAEHCRP